MEKPEGYNAMSESNRQKSNAGNEFDGAIRSELDMLCRIGAIKGYLTNQNLNHPEYAYEKQYLANYIITTNEDKYIAVRSTRSFRQDCIKICYYDLDGVARFANFSEDLVASIIVVDDTELDSSGFVNIREKFRNGEYYCPATHLFALSEFIHFLTEYRYHALSDSTDDVDASIFESLMVAEPSGSAYGKAGNELERILADILSDYKNLRAFKKDENGALPLFSLILSKLVAENKLSTDDIVRVKASNTIPMLNSGGNPKADVVVFIELLNGETLIETISIKNTKANRVSCHDYGIDDYIRVLDIRNSRLEEYIKWFGEAGSAKNMVKLFKPGYSLEEFESELLKKKEILVEWALTGAHDKDNLIDSEMQVSRYLLIRKENIMQFYNMIEYIQKLDAFTGSFGLPFGWTYPSKQKGKRIQLKVPIILD
ncbi:MAG TPA: hypothetical protein DCR04_11555 [Flavobacteriales bacterium]|nr:hypothetical protein [Flavobacteriales bacterium]